MVAMAIVHGVQTSGLLAIVQHMKFCYMAVFEKPESWSRFVEQPSI